MSVLFKGPGWVPGSPRLGNHEDLPEVNIFLYPLIAEFALETTSNSFNCFILLSVSFSLKLFILMPNLQYIESIYLQSNPTVIEVTLRYDRP